MKQSIFPFLLILTILGCNGQTKSQKTVMNSEDSIALKQKYDKIFTNGLTSLFNKPYKLQDKYVLVENDTIYYPKDLPINKEIFFYGYDDGYQLSLSVKRTTLTNFSYSFRQISNDNKTLYSKDGIAILDPRLVMEEEQNIGTRIKTILQFEPLYKDMSDSFMFDFTFAHDDEIKLSVNIRLRCKDIKSGEVYKDNYALMLEAQ